MFKGLLVKQIIFSAIVSLLVIILQQTTEGLIHPHIFSVIVFCTALNLIVMGLIAYGRTFDPKTAVVFTIAAIGVHFFLSMVFAVAYLYFVVQKDLHFVLTFFLLYLMFMVFELIVLLNTLRAQN